MNAVDSTSRKKRRRYVLPILSAFVTLVLIALFYIPLPYYVYAPGSAESLQPLIDVQGGHKTEKGAFMLTTVLVIYADNVYDFLYGLLLPHHQVYPVSLVSGGLSDRQYNNVEVYMMQSSHQNAEIAALRFLHKPIRVVVNGVEVVSVESKSPAMKALLPGDVITAVNGQSMRDPANLFRVLTHARVGQHVELTILRKTKTLHMNIPLIALPPLPGHKKPRAGIGIIPAVSQVVKTPIAIHIHSGAIDGPSAGLMFTLEVINQLYTGGDLTRGYKIAGTGTISANGGIGQIGGVAHKVIAANTAGASYFFVPADTQAGDTNELHAMQEAKKIHTHMKIVPVSNLRQAVAFLKRLKPKTD